MTELEKHIVNLLLDNDCVIVPGFGGFMAHRIPASYDKTNGLYTPPTRTIGFNPLLTMNDSLLAQSYANCYDISYPEALRHIESDVDNLKRTIESEGVHNICGVGSIVLTSNGSYDFLPNKDGFITPEYYGFDTFEIDIIKEEHISEDNHTKTASTQIPANEIKSIFDNNISEQRNTNISECASKQEEPTSTRKEISLRIPLSMIQQIAAACIIVILFMSFPAKIGDSSKSRTSHGAMDTSLMYSILPKEITSGKPEKLNLTETQNNKLREQKTTSETDVSVVKPNRPFYAIVMASRITRNNAELYIQKLQEKGIKDLQVYTSNGYTKVIYKKFTDKESAQTALRNLPQSETFNGCWITEVR